MELYGLTAPSTHLQSFNFEILDVIVLDQNYHTSIACYIILRSNPEFSLDISKQIPQTGFDKPQCGRS